jgi:lipoate synthase
MGIKVETIITDDQGNRIVVHHQYEEETSLLDKNVDDIELLVMKAKKDMGKSAELELLRLNQSDYTKKKKP